MIVFRVSLYSKEILAGVTVLSLPVLIYYISSETHEEYSDEQDRVNQEAPQDAPVAVDDNVSDLVPVQAKTWVRSLISRRLSSH